MVANRTPHARRRRLSIDEHDNLYCGRTRERVIKEAIFRVLPDIAEVERIFLIIKAQKEY